MKILIEFLVILILLSVWLLVIKYIINYQKKK